MITPDARLMPPVVSEEDITGPAGSIKIVKLTITESPSGGETFPIRWMLIVSSHTADAYAALWHRGRWNELWELREVICKVSSMDRDTFEKAEEWTYVIDLLADYVSNILRIERGDR